MIKNAFRLYKRHFVKLVLIAAFVSFLTSTITYLMGYLETFIYGFFPDVFDMYSVDVSNITLPDILSKLTNNFRLDFDLSIWAVSAGIDALRCVICSPLLFSLTYVSVRALNNENIKFRDIFYFFKPKILSKAILLGVFVNLFSMLLSGYKDMFWTDRNVYSVLYLLEIVIRIGFFLAVYILINDNDIKLVELIKKSVSKIEGNILRYIGLNISITVVTLLITFVIQQFISRIILYYPLISNIIIFMVLAVITPLFNLLYGGFAMNILEPEFIMENDDYQGDDTDDVDYSVPDYVWSFSAETESVSDFDVIKALENSEMPPDIKDHFDVKRFLKKSIKALALDIENFESYAGGREARNTKDFEFDGEIKTMTLSISRLSDSAPFVITFEIQS